MDVFDEEDDWVEVNDLIGDNLIVDNLSFNDIYTDGPGDIEDIEINDLIYKLVKSSDGWYFVDDLNG